MLQVHGNNHTEQKPSFHPSSINNEYMLSQDSVGFNEIASRPSRPPSSKTQEKQLSVEMRHPRN